MPQSKSRKDELKEILAEKNISVNVVASLSGRSRQTVRGQFNSKTRLSEEDYNFYKKIIDSIDTENYYEKYIRGDVSPKKEVLETRCENKIRIREFMASNNIRNLTAARICNITLQHFIALINLSNHHKLSDTKTNDILSKLEKYVKNKEKDKSI